MLHEQAPHRQLPQRSAPGQPQHEVAANEAHQIECRHRHHGLVAVSSASPPKSRKSGRRNIFGANDNAPRTPNPVIKERVLKLVEPACAGSTSNGVDPLQLTFLPVNEQANRDGGAWKPPVNIATGRASSQGPRQEHGICDGLAAYNDGNHNRRTDAKKS